MSSSLLLEPLSLVVDRAVRLATEEQGFREQIRRLAQAILDATEKSQREVGPVATPETVIATITDAVELASDDGREVSRLDCVPAAVEVPPLTLGQKLATADPTISLPHRWVSKVEDDLAVIEARCRLKSTAARWAATRRRRIEEGAAFATEINRGDREIIDEAKRLPNCYLWMCRPEAPVPDDLRLWEEVGGCFEAVADVLGVLQQLQYEPGANQIEFEQALDLLAEAQSALRASIVTLDVPSDTDQMQVYNWLKTTACENQIYIQRFMRSDDPADSSQWADLSARIEVLDSRMQEDRKRSKERKRRLGKVRHKVSLLAKSEDDAGDHWRIIAATVDDLVNSGLPASNRELRELLVPVVDDIPDLGETPAGFQMVLREIDRFLATCPTPDTAPVPKHSAQVQSVAHLLAGKSVVLIGGDVRPWAYKALKEAFRLTDLYWVATREHAPTEYFEPYIARPDVAVALLAIRWSSHSYTDIGPFCNRYGKPLVRLPSGYNPNQVASQIMSQCSDRLKE